MKLIGRWAVRSQIVLLEELNKFVPHQVHKADIVAADGTTHLRQEADGVVAICANPNPAAIATADCLPLIICSPQKALALHISRKTVIHGLLDHVKQHLDVASIIGAYIGPHICATHLTFTRQGEEVRQFMQRFPRASSVVGAHTHLSLREVVNEYLVWWGITTSNISADSRCTYETPTLPSYRRCLDTKTSFTAELVTSVSWGNQQSKEIKIL